MTRRAAITGYPVSHSRSPLIHNRWLALHGIDGTYERIAVAPDEARCFYESLGDQGLVGCNVTVPNKEVAVEVCATLDEAARAMGAVNLLWVEGDGRVHGANTDGFGFLGNLDQTAPGWDEDLREAVVLGAGGAARAIVWALLSRGVKTVTIVNRTRSKAEEICARFGSDSKAADWGELTGLLGTAGLLVNTTSLGMQGQPPLEIDLSALPVSALVTDAVYAPLETTLLAAARARGNPVVDGLGMLLHQAVPSFERWFGVRPQVTDELRALLLADLGVAA